MFNFGNSKKDNEEQKKGIQNARDIMDSGFVGGISKLFMGSENTKKVYNALDMGEAALSGQAMEGVGLEATGVVKSIEDTGTTVNDNPIVNISMRAISSVGTEWDVVAQAMVSRLAIPRVGDTVRFKYSPVDPSKIAIVS